MKILLIEDDEDKREDLLSFVKENLTENVTVARSIQSGKKALSEEEFDLILLDMTIPTFDISPTEEGGRTQAFGGRLILSQMIRKRILTKVVVVTLFDLFGRGDEEISLTELNNQLKDNFPQIYCGAVQYSVRMIGWKEELLKKIKSLIK